MSSSTVHVFARWKVREGNLPEVLRLLQALAEQTLTEDGNLFYQVNQSKEDSHTLLLYEGYKSESAQKAHVDSSHFQLLAIQQLIPLLEERQVFLTNPLEL